MGCFPNQVAESFTPSQTRLFPKYQQQLKKVTNEAEAVIAHEAMGSAILNCFNKGGDKGSFERFLEQFRLDEPRGVTNLGTHDLDVAEEVDITEWEDL